LAARDVSLTGSQDGTGMTDTQLAVWQGHKTFAVRRVGLAAVIAVVVGALAYVVDAALLWTAVQVTADASSVNDPHVTFIGSALWLWRIVLIPVQAVALALVIAWTRRARLNLDAFPDARPALGPGWLIAGWLVPVANLVVPGRMVASIARESVRSRWVLVRVWLWWVGFVVLIAGTRLLGVPASNREFELATNPDIDLLTEHYRSWAVGEVVPVAAGVLSAVCFAVAVRRISEAQEERIERGRYEEQNRLSSTLG
jgi:hypothetical protein